MQAIVGSDEMEIEPTSEWIRRTLHQIEDLTAGDRFLTLLRSEDDQLNALCEPDGFVLEWYNGKQGGAQVAYRNGEGRDHQPQRRQGIFSSIFAPAPEILGSRLPLEATATILDAYVAGADRFEGLRWERLYR